MTVPPPEQSFGFLISEAARLLRLDFDRRARAIGLTRAQWSVLAYLCRNEGINQAGLAELMEIQPITLVRHLDRLEEAGWLERRPIPGDRRARALHLTAKAWPILDRMFALAAETWDDALSGLSLAAREQLLSSLARVRRNLSLGDTASAAGRDTGTDGG